MGVKWQTVALENLSNEVTVGFVGSMTQEYVDDGIPFLRSKNINEFRVKWDDIRYIAKSFHEKIKKSKLAPGDVVIVRTGKPGVSCVIPESLPEANCSDVVIVRVNKKILNEHFFCYFMNSNAASHVSAHLVGAVQQHFNVGAAKKLMVPVPSIEEQNRIVNVLKTIDDRIELNRQMNETLEQVAQALFKSWFVDFDPVIDNALDAGNPIPEELEARAEQRRQLRNAVAQGRASAPGLPDEIRSLFPSEFELTDEMGWIPKGWKVSTTHDEFDIKGGSTPSTKNPDFWEGGDINWTSPKDLSGKADKVLLDTERKITRQGLGKITSGLLPVDTVLMSSRAPVGYLALAKVPVAINQGYIALICNKTITPEYSIQWLSSVMDEIKSISGGTTFSEISKKTFRSIKLVVPVEGVVTEYTKYVAEYYQRIAQAVKESDSLSALRDYLLPKLISGELQIPDAEQQIAEVMS